MHHREQAMTRTSVATTAPIAVSGAEAERPPGQHRQRRAGEIADAIPDFLERLPGKCAP
jgi:hypothetical protein